LSFTKYTWTYSKLTLIVFFTHHNKSFLSGDESGMDETVEIISLLANIDISINKIVDDIVEIHFYGEG